MATPAEARVGLVIVGDEILCGRTRDANGGWLGERLDALGYVVRRIVVVPDEEPVIREEVERMLDAAPTVIVTGGLGPTHDDRTTATLARHFDRALVVDTSGWNRMLERYAKRFAGEEPPADLLEAARKMVEIPEGATPLANPVGAATGYVIHDARPREGDAEAGGVTRRVIVLPGVPRELQAMWTDAVEGRILPPLARLDVVEMDVALPEAGFARTLEDVGRAFPDVAIGSYPKATELRVTLRFRGTRERAEAARDAFRERVGSEHVLGG